MTTYMRISLTMAVHLVAAGYLVIILEAELIIHDGSSGGAISLARLCSSSYSSNITTTGNVMYVMFRTDGSIVSRGFRAQWSAVNITAGWLDSTPQVSSTPGTTSYTTQASTFIPVGQGCQMAINICTNRFWTASLTSENFCDTVRQFMLCVRSICPLAPAVPPLVSVNFAMSSPSS
ncbi:cubilin-like [Elysia marginata]|uniref:Cubilin-like n=1 Tax=Elysia marginata TaxID=1093978 RepID=A0AAV4G7G6_9GAST|nr:cubilin-like [Elysia marginata]